MAPVSSRGGAQLSCLPLAGDDQGIPGQHTLNKQGTTDPIAGVQQLLSSEGSC